MTLPGNTALQKFEQDLTLNPMDWELRLIYSDWLEEQGNELLAKTHRWMALHKNLPDTLHLEDWKHTDSPSAYWSSEQNDNCQWDKPENKWNQYYRIYALPLRIFRLLSGRRFPAYGNPETLWCGYDNLQGAILDLGRVLREQGDI